MTNLGGLAMHQIRRANHAAAKGHSDSLVSEAYAKYRNLPAELANYRYADACCFRYSRSGRDHDVIGLKSLDLLDRNLIVAPDLYVFAQLSNVLDEIKRKGIVLVYYEHHLLNGYFLYFDALLRLVALDFGGGNLVQHIQAFGYPGKWHMLSVQSGVVLRQDKEELERRIIDSPERNGSANLLRIVLFGRRRPY